MMHRRLLDRALSHAARLARSTVHLARRRPASLTPEHDSTPQKPETFVSAPSPDDSTGCSSPACSTATASTATYRVSSSDPTRGTCQQPDQTSGGGDAVADQLATTDASSSTPEGDEPAPAVAHYERGLAMARAHRWNWAQRELELAARMLSDGPTRTDLETVRAARRYLRALQKHPRDARTRILLGKCYFELDMGEDAEREFRQVLTLAPEEPEPHYFLALEYCYRGMTEEAERYYAQAQSLVEGLPPFSSLLAEYRQVADVESGE